MKPANPTKNSQNEIAPPKPLYQQVKTYVLKNIRSGNWPVHFQIPSEHTLVRDMEISRMTIHRALRELTQEGYLKRIQGVGTFVAEGRQKKNPVELKAIDTQVRSRGHTYHCDIHFLQSEPISNEYAIKLGLKEGDDVFRCYAIHRENGIPVMLEDRHINPTFVPDFLQNDFSQKTMESYLQEKFSMLSHEHQLQAVTSNPEAHHFLELEQPTPCIQINKHTWNGNKSVSIVRQLYPGHRYQIHW